VNTDKHGSVFIGGFILCSFAQTKFEMSGSLRAGLVLAFLLNGGIGGFTRDTYQFRGRVVQNGGKPFTKIVPVAFLQGATTPFSAQTVVDPGGRFTFKGLLPGMYTLIVAVPRQGEKRQTIEVGPALADSSGRVELTILFERKPEVENVGEISVSQLAVPGKATREYEKALGRLEKRDIAGAVTHLKKAVELAPKFAAAWNHLGTIAYQTKNYSEAEKYFREALAQDPDSYSPLVNLAAALFSQGKIAESLPINERAVDARPDDPLAHSQLGQNYFRLGRIEEAEKHLKQAKALDPRHFSLPQLVLAEIYERREDYAAMIAELQEFLRYHPDSEFAARATRAIEAARTKAKAGSPPNP